jgi:phosphate transport system permease protein
MAESAAIRRRRIIDVAFMVLGVVLIALALGMLVALIADLVRDGAGRLSWQFLSSLPSRHPDKAGIKIPLIGTCLVMLVTAFTALPLGIAAGVYLEEYARKNWLTTIIEINIANLAGVPSIIWGLMALGLLVYELGFQRSILTAGLTLAMLVLPIIIVATREAIRAIPRGISEASFALGATRWETVRHHLVPYSLSSILTGAIIAMSRAIGETAPLVTIGALAFISYAPPSPIQPNPPFISFEWLSSEISVLPIQMFNWVSHPNPRFQANAAAAGLVLLLITLTMNGLAIWLRYRSRASIRW